MKKSIFTFRKLTRWALALSVFSSLAAEAQQDPRAREILDQVAARYKKIASFEARVSFTLEDPVQETSDTRELSVAVKGDKYRYKLGDQEIYNDTRYSWTHDQEMMEAYKAEAEPDGFKPTDIFNVYKSGYKYRLVNEETFEGKPCYVIDMEPEDREEQFFKQRFYIDKKSSAVLCYVQFERQTNRRFRYVISDFKEKSLPDSHFVFDAAEHGVELIDLTEG